MAKFNSTWLMSKRQFRTLTGVDAATFREWVARLRPHWQDRIVSPKNRPGRPWGAGGLEDHLLVLLIFIPMRDHTRFYGLSVSNKQTGHQPIFKAY